MQATRMKDYDMLNKSPATEIDQSTLPDWDLSHLYKSFDDPQIKTDLAKAQNEATSFRTDYFEKVTSLSGDALAKSIARMEALDETLSKIMTYIGLLYQTKLETPEVGKAYQDLQEQITDLSSPLIFYTLELNNIPEADLQKKYAESTALTAYKPWLNVLRLYKDHQLSDEMETLLNDKSVVGSSAWCRLYEESLAALKFPFKGKDLSCTEILNLLSDKDPTNRKEAAETLGKVLGENIRLFTMITNTLAKDKEINDRWRKYPNIVSSRNLANQVEDEVVEALTETVKEHYPVLSHKYYKLKAKWFGSDTLNYWDRNAPLPQDQDPPFSWKDCQNLVLTAYEEFSPEMAAVGKRFFDEGWIDAKVYKGKTSGAFSHPSVPSSHPYILVNYLGKSRDVMTVAHELGHGVHQVLASKQGYFKSHTPLTIAETASVFGEMLTFRKLLSQKSDPMARKILLASKVEDMLNTVVRQIAFFEFEKKLHTARRQGELSSEQIGEFWMEIQTTSLGPAITFDDNYKNYWAYISHFIHTPFYVYAYAFGDCLVNSLYALYQNTSSPQEKDLFVKNYLDLLKAGGSKKHKELLSPFGLDASQKSFWTKGLAMISSMIKEIEEIDQQR